MIALKGRPILLRKPVSGPTTPVGQQGFDLGELELAAGDDLPQAVFAAVALEFLVGLADLLAALGAGRCEDSEVARDRIVVVGLRALDDVLGHGGDLAHEGGA